MDMTPPPFSTSSQERHSMITPSPYRYGGLKFWRLAQESISHLNPDFAGPAAEAWDVHHVLFRKALALHIVFSNEPFWI
jgi:hypothetical protein